MPKAKKWRQRTGVWTPLSRATIPESELALAARTYGDDSVRTLHVPTMEVWKNDRYQVLVTPWPMPEGHAPMVWLSIRRLDRQPIHDWRDLQRIKNQLLGPECEALELYPAESRLTDTSNQFHLFGFADATVRIPVGFWQREILEHPGGKAKQRPFEPEVS